MSKRLFLIAALVALGGCRARTQSDNLLEVITQAARTVSANGAPNGSCIGLQVHGEGIPSGTYFMVCNKSGGPLHEGPNTEFQINTASGTDVLPGTDDSMSVAPEEEGGGVGGTHPLEGK